LEGLHELRLATSILQEKFNQVLSSILEEHQLTHQKQYMAEMLNIAAEFEGLKSHIRKNTLSWLFVPFQ
jgi:hypothetical protein